MKTVRLTPVIMYEITAKIAYRGFHNQDISRYANTFLGEANFTQMMLHQEVYV